MVTIRGLLRPDGRPPCRQPDLPDPHARHRRHPADVAHSPTACSGANLRASGVDWDLRRDSDVGHGVRRSSTGRSGRTPTATRSRGTGCACRRCARPPTSSSSCSTACRAGRSWRRCPRIIKVPAGEACVATENPLGEMGYYVVSKGDLGPFRVKIRSASASTTSRSRRGCSRASYVPDVITILASLYFILGDIDR